MCLRQKFAAAWTRVQKEQANRCQESFRFAAGNLSLPHQDFPEADVCLQGADGISSHCAIGNTIKRLAGSEETRDGLIIQIVKLGKNEVLIVELRELIGEKPHCLRARRLSLGRARSISERVKKVCNGPVVSERESPNIPSTSCSELFQLPALWAHSDATLELACRREDLLPDLNIAGNERFAFCVELETRYEE